MVVAWGNVLVMIVGMVVVGTGDGSVDDVVIVAGVVVVTDALVDR